MPLRPTPPRFVLALCVTLLVVTNIGPALATVDTAGSERPCSHASDVNEAGAFHADEAVGIACPASCGIEGPARTGPVADRRGGPGLNLTFWTAPPRTYDRLHNASAIRAARDEGVLAPAASLDDGYPFVRYGNTLVYRFELSGTTNTLFDRLRRQPGTTPTERFGAFVGHEWYPVRPDPAVQFFQRRPTTHPLELNWSASVTAGAVRVVTDRDRGTLYLVTDTENVVYDYSGRPETRGYIGSLRTRLFVFVDNNRSVSTDRSHLIRPHELTFDDDEILLLNASDGQRITGTTTVYPGEELDVELVARNGSGFNVTKTVTVNRSGGFSFEVDLSTLEPGTELAVRKRGRTRREATGLVGVDAVILADRSQTGGTVLYDVEGYLDDGGFVVARTPNGTIAGARYVGPGRFDVRLTLHPPVTDRRVVTLAAYRDVDGDRHFDGQTAERPYGTNGTNVTHRVVVYAEETVTTTTATPETTHDRAAETSTTGPGFGAVLSLAALLVATAALSRHRP